MNFDIANFRVTFPEFADLSRYPTARIQFWVTLASSQLDSTIWGTTWVNGVSLYVAHELVLSDQNVKAAAVGGTPGGASGLVSSKSVGSVNVSYDTGSIAEQGAGFWNQTNYGRQFYRLVRIFGAGCVQL